MAGLPSACSGERYCGVPITAPVRVMPTPSAARAIPKSVTFTLPCGVTIRLAGLTSRCTIPARWAAPSASPTWASRSRTAAGSRSRPPPIRFESGSPSTSSMTRNGRGWPEPSVAARSPTSKTEAMPGWCSAAAWRASVSKRARKVASSAYSTLSSLTATSRPSTVSVARQTSPMPPVAMRESSR